MAGIQANGQGLGMSACAGMMALLDVFKSNVTNY
jgi:hypothetical protein